MIDRFLFSWMGEPSNLSHYIDFDMGKWVYMGWERRGRDLCEEGGGREGVWLLWWKVGR